MRIGLLGLGTIARTHLRVLDQLPGTEVAFGVDPAELLGAVLHLRSHRRWSARSGWSGSTQRPPHRGGSCARSTTLTSTSSTPSGRASSPEGWTRGPNQLSLLSRFVTGFQVVEREESADGFTTRCRLRYDGGSALLVANWWAADSSKQTSLHFDDGTAGREAGYSLGRELASVLEHRA
jgi:hypothetical protein